MTRILIVDDEAPLAEALSTLFELENIAAATACDREAAERLLAGEHFPVILADVRLRSEEEGLMLLESIRTLSPRSKIATMTGYATPALEEQLCSLIGLENLSYEEVSERLGIPLGSVGPLYIRAKSRLRRLIAVG